MKNFILKVLMISILMSLNACTYNISMAHTSGTASDVSDDTSSSTPTISPTVTVPISPTLPPRLIK
jgi:hypothetical protein